MSDKPSVLDEETARRRDDIVRRMIATPPSPNPKFAKESNRGRPPKAKPAE
jgi:hypothetical protein